VLGEEERGSILKPILRDRIRFNLSLEVKLIDLVVAASLKKTPI